MTILSQAKRELDLIDFGEAHTKVMLEILEKFFDQWDSGGAVHAVAPVLQKLIAGVPLSPLQGTEDEWNDVSGVPGEPMWQNNRCSSVFRDGTGRCYDIDTPGRPSICFPYKPLRQAPLDPVMVFVP